ncbi:MAG TPA: amidohydrolase family protein [Pirellula sp.]|nr:amidohydrolase family protein [Pirellula sp.]
MIEQPEPFVVSADWIVPVESEPIPNGLLVIAHGTILYVGNNLPLEFLALKLIHLTGHAILPGLVNSHCHLEFSDLPEPIPAGDSFPDWIRRLLAYRKSKSDDSVQLAENRCAAIKCGIRESYVSGVRWIVDMTTQPWGPDWIESSVKEIHASLPQSFAPKNPIAIQPCLELLDLSKNQFERSFSFAEQQANAPSSDQIGRIGYAPHAPYTASRNVTKLCAEWSRAQSRLVTMHLAESVDEMEWLRDRVGKFLDLLGPFISTDYFEELGQVSEHVQFLKQAWRATVAHGNYLSNSDLCDLASHSENMAVVHCPRTHRHFGHQYRASLKYPLAERIVSGVRHFIGTDSRASNPDLNLWSEVKLVRANHPSVSSLEILKMITTSPAEFLEISDRYGFIRPGQPSTITAITLSKDCPSLNSTVNAERVYDALLAANTVSAPLEMVIAKVARWS